MKKEEVTKPALEIFKAEMFKYESRGLNVNIGEQSAEIANQILNKYLSDHGQKVFRNEDATLKGYGDTWFTVQRKYDTHTAILANIQPLYCQHKNTTIWEPHLAGARKCLDCDMEWNNNWGEWRKICKHEPDKTKFMGIDIASTHCKHCKKKLKAKWEAM